jgi:hypothetical protein
VTCRARSDVRGALCGTKRPTSCGIPSAGDEPAAAFRMTEAELLSTFASRGVTRGSELYLRPADALALLYE